jgi:hypothetical protein
VAERVPEFGGVFYDANGDINVYLMNSAQQEEARPALIAVFGKEFFLQDFTHQSRKMIVLQGQYGFSELSEWRRRARVIFKDSRVIFLDIDEARNRISIGVENIAAASSVEKELASLGIPREAVIIEEAEPVELDAMLRDTIRPTAGGLQIGFDRDTTRRWCTLGFNAHLHVPTSANPGRYIRGFVTNSHCTAVRHSVTNTPYYQNSVGPSVGTEFRDPPGFTGGECPQGSRCRWSDSAFVAYNSSTNSERKVAATAQMMGNPNADPLLIHSFHTVVGERSVVWGNRVEKVGARTGWTGGLVDMTCVDFIYEGVLLLCSHRGQYGRDGGDSGSPIFRIS